MKNCKKKKKKEEISSSEENSRRYCPNEELYERLSSDVILGDTVQ